MREIRTSGLMSGDGKRGFATAPVLDSTDQGPQAAHSGRYSWHASESRGLLGRNAGIQDRDGAALVFDSLANRFPFIEKICGDGGYQGTTVEEASPRPMEIIKRNQAGFQVLPKRWIVERTLAWLGINRRMAKHF
ncbi:hypothetical protein [Rhizobium rhododendri]|uniref:Transposase n=1 Tax=Rhizobium rhododendri TaxID=2506430 RepID=A0ABY8IRM3_9HYPH|nr:hypothetical protein [Rhizobium rhododendri]WFS26115.1 hypothetical protein PR018_23435 [Rhizobium rhododendri]